MTVAVTATQTSQSDIVVVWTDSEAAPSGWTVEVDIDSAGPVKVADYFGTGFEYLYSEAADFTVGASYVFTITNIDTTTFGDSPAVVISILGLVDPLADTIRYTTLVEVKRVLNITDTAVDDDLTAAIIAAETAIDQFNGVSYPTDEVPGIPIQLKVWALDASTAVYKLRDTTAGGLDIGADWIGAIDVTDQVGKALRRNPLAMGLKRAWGVA